VEEGKAEMLARQEKVATRPASGRPRPREADRHVGARVRERRIVLGLTQQRVGEAIGVTPQQAHKYEQGVNRITAGHLYLLARALGVGVGHFFEGLGAGPPAAPTPGQRRLLALARSFVAIPTRQQQEALCEVARALVGAEADHGA
jgi:transcriptional regulator with XRE-family HTH domain